MENRVEQLEVMVKAMKMSPAPSNATTGVVGGMGTASSAEVAKDWLANTLRKASITNFSDIYHKGGVDSKFNGMVFVKFPTKYALDQATVVFNSLRAGMAGERSFMSEDQPIQVRTVHKFLREVKKLMTSSEWGYTKSSVRYDLDTKTLSVAGDEILEVSVEKYKLNIKYLDAAWTGWAELQQDIQFGAIQKELQDKLSQAEKGLDKGKGKGA